MVATENNKKIEHIKIPIIIEESKILHRLNDGFKIKFTTIKYLEYDSNNRGLRVHDKAKIGYSCLCDLDSNFNFTWQTTPITEVISKTEFKTLNSHYKIIENEK